MDRFTVTKVAALQIGDRFYKATDKSKTVLTKVESGFSEWLIQKFKGKCFYIQDGGKYPVPINPDTAVVFLRHSKDH